MLVPIAVATVFAVQFIHERFRSQRFQLARLDAQTNLYGELFLKLFTSRQLFIDFCRLEVIYCTVLLLQYIIMVYISTGLSLP